MADEPVNESAELDLDNENSDESAQPGIANAAKQGVDNARPDNKSQRNTSSAPPKNR